VGALGEKVGELGDMKVAIVVGTRPEIVKMAPVVRACQDTGTPYVLIHTGQHYSFELDGLFFAELGLPAADYNLSVGSGHPAGQVGRIMEGLAGILELEAIEILLVQGDTNSALAAALTANKAEIAVGHVEAGLRSHDRTMPEEVNRVLIDHMADILFAPTETGAANLCAEGIDASRVHVTGNTVVDELRLQLAEVDANDILDGRQLFSGRYAIATVHRAENVNDGRRLHGIFTGLAAVAEDFGMPILIPLHPRTAQRLEDLHFSIPPSIKLLPSLGYHEMLGLMSRAALILTDSGGIQEEACVMGIPCVTLRDSTERPESVAVGANVLAGADPLVILDMARRMVTVPRDWPNPFGSGHSGRAILDVLLEAEREGRVSSLRAARPGRELGVPAARVGAPEALGPVGAFVAIPPVVRRVVAADFETDGGTDGGSAEADPRTTIVVQMVTRDLAMVTAEIDRAARGLERPEHFVVDDPEAVGVVLEVDALRDVGT
jgi:UDP-N-acetylglucosamine 2-epimerase (non-hydrolysing)